ncbi:polysaccharide pyruvyl transferase family protein [Vibrio breoganii]
MKTFVIGYFDRNVGDELMLKTLITKNRNRSYIINGCSEHDINVYKGWYDDVRKSRNKLKDMLCSKEIVFIGGSLFQDFSDKAYVYYFKLCLFLLLGRITNKKVSILSSNLGPFTNNKTKLLVKIITLLASNVVVRDKLSQDIAVNKNTKLARDIVEFSDVKPSCKEKAYIGINIIDSVNLDNDIYLSNMLSDIIAKAKCLKKIKLFIFHYQDEIISLELARKLREEEPSFEINIVRFLNVESFISEFENVDYMFCSRFHSMIISINMHIPFTLYVYSNKVNEYLNTHYGISKLPMSEIGNEIKIEYIEDKEDFYVL